MAYGRADAVCRLSVASNKVLFMSKVTRGVFRMSRDHVEVAGQLSPFLRFCIGIAIVAFAITPLVFVVLKA